jgi:Ca-activated chloride channel family protein
MSNIDAKTTIPPWRTFVGSLGERLRGDKKVLQFALWGALGCLAGALLGELLLAATHAPRPPAQAVSLLIDCSTSMLGRGNAEASRGTKLDEVKSAASEFIGRQDLSRDLIAVVAFGSTANAATKLENDATRLRRAITGLNPQGSTAMDSGLDVAAMQLDDAMNPSLQPFIKNILLFTDGQPDNPGLALAAAKRCREQKMKIVAIGTGDADIAFLAQITADPNLVVSAQSGNFGESFQQAEKAIFGGSLVESSSTQAGFLRSLLQTIGWSALLGWGGSLALIAGQNLYVRRAALSKNELLIGTFGGLFAGVLAGAAGQLLFAISKSGAHLPLAGPAITATINAIGRIVGWTLLGGLIGRGLALFVPNLQPRYAWMGGSLGGAAAAVAFLFIAFLGDIPARLLGAAILGACIGLMVALFEAAFRELWLEVRFGTREVVNVSLGSSPVKIGSDSRSCTIYARGARPLAVGYRLDDAGVECIDYATEKSTRVQPGDERVVGNVTVTVRASTTTQVANSVSKNTTRPSVSAVPPPPQKAKDGAAVSTTPARFATSSKPEIVRTVKPPPPPPPPKRRP